MRILARSLAHTMVIALAAALCAVLTAVGGTLTAAVTLTATALIVPGTAVPNPATVPGYMENAVDYYVSPTTASCASVCIPEPVPYLAQFWPFPWEGWGGLSGAKLDESVASGVAQLTSDLVGTNNPSPQSPVVIFGYSQGATVASIEKSQLSMLSPEDQADINFVLIGNPNRPNGGLFERLAMFGTVPILDATFGMPTPTNTDMSTVDVAFQYDGVADFPLYPINLLADLNATLGFWYIHGSYLAPDGRNPDELPNGLTPTELAAAIADPANQQHLAGSDTTYVLIPTPNLPLLQPLREFGAFTHTEFLTTPLIDLIQPALGVLIETGYDRSLPYGQPAPFRLIPLVNP
ncbi:MAG: PE-PPE domain-containing protein, partial [Mycobacterium sp.]